MRPVSLLTHHTTGVSRNALLIAFLMDTPFYLMHILMRALTFSAWQYYILAVSIKHSSLSWNDKNVEENELFLRAIFVFGRTHAREMRTCRNRSRRLYAKSLPVFGISCCFKQVCDTDKSDMILLRDVFLPAPVHYCAALLLLQKLNSWKRKFFTGSLTDVFMQDLWKIILNLVTFHIWAYH